MVASLKFWFGNVGELQSVQARYFRHTALADLTAIKLTASIALKN